MTTSTFIDAEGNTCCISLRGESQEEEQPGSLEDFLEVMGENNKALSLSEGCTIKPPQGEKV